MLYRVVIGDAQQVRAIVELELSGYVITEQGALCVHADPQSVIGVWAPGQWRSIMEVESWNRARKAGVGEDTRGRQASRPLQAL